MAYLKLLEKQADKMCATLGDWEQNVLRRIGRRLKDIGSMSYADAQAINNAVLAKQDFNAVMVELAQLTGQNVRDVYQMYDDFIAEQHESKKPLYDYRNKSFVPFADNKDLQAITRAYAQTTAAEFVNFSMTKANAIGFVDKNGVFVPMEKQFKQVLDKSVMSLATGTSTFDAEVIEAIKQLGGSGVRVNYGSGVTRSLDGMVRQNLLWGAKQAAKEYEAMVGEELDCDGIEIDWHGNPRPAHEFMQGRQFVIGKSRTVNGKRFDGTDDTTSPISGKNVIDSLNDYGCLHYETHIICGVSEPVYSQQELNRLNAENSRPIEVDGVTKTGYEWKKTMRRLERATKQTRLEREGMKAAGKKAEAKKLNDRINAIKKKYDTIAEKTGIAKDYQRMSMQKGSSYQHYIKGETIKIKNTSGAAPFTANTEAEIRTEVDNFENVFGKLNSLNEIKNKKYENNGVYGGFNDNDGVLTLFGFGGKNGKETMVNLAKKMHKKGRWSTKSPQHPLRHELTHAWLCQQKDMPGFQEKIEKINEIKNNFLKKLTGDEQSDNILIKETLSSYGLSRYAEIDDLICECGAEYMTKKPRTMAKTVIEILLRSK